MAEVAQDMARTEAWDTGDYSRSIEGVAGVGDGQAIGTYQRQRLVCGFHRVRHPSRSLPSTSCPVLRSGWV